MSMFPEVRLRRLRRTPSLRRMFDMPLPGPEKFIWPVFVLAGNGERQAIDAMPGQYRMGIDTLLKELKPVADAGIGGILIFGLVDESEKDKSGTAAYSEQGVVQQAVRAVRREHSELVLFTDVCLCAYTEHGHCGPLSGSGDVDNDAANEILAKVAVSHADAGADCVAPSAMMDGQVLAIRSALDGAGLKDTLLMSYSTKFASAMYGPFREAEQSAPQQGDRRGYQASYGDLRQALRESEFDEEEGADVLMVNWCFQNRWFGWRGMAAGWVLAGLLSAARAQAPIQLRDVTAEAGLDFKHTHAGSGKLYVFEPMSAGLALFDYDNDGDADLYLNNFGPNALYRNNGDGTFSDATRSASLDNGNQVGAGANFLDLEGDGDLDLFVSNYVGFSYDNHKVLYDVGRPVYSGPRDYAPTPDNLFRNNGDGTFTDVTVVSGVGQYAGTGMGTVCADFDNDGDTDIYVANDDWGNFLFRNDGTGAFEEEGLVTGTAYDVSGDAQSSMGVACGDYNNDGWIDLYVTGYKSELAVLYKNAGDGLFDDVTPVAGAGKDTYPYVNWGTEFVDFDNDGHRDAVILNWRDRPTILRNDSPGGNHWLQVRLRGVKTNRDGVGARVKVVAGDLAQVDEVHSGRGYQSHYGTRLHFGLGKRARVDRIEIRWIGGGTDVHKDIPVDRIVTITEGDPKPAHP